LLTARGYPLLALDLLRAPSGLAFDLSLRAAYDLCGMPLHAAVERKSLELIDYLLEERNLRGLYEKVKVES
jgi:hypothetical protein